MKSVNHKSQSNSRVRKPIPKQNHTPTHKNKCSSQSVHGDLATNNMRRCQMVMEHLEIS